jgi:subtilisin family serine protease
MLRRWVFIFVTVHILVASSAKAQTSKGGQMAKLTHSLVFLHEQHAARVAQRSAAPFSSNDPLVTLVNDRVVVDAVASGDVNVLKSDLISLGMQQAVAFGRVVSGQLPISAIPAAAGLGSLRFAQSAAAMTHAGSVASQGDHAIRSDIARNTFALDGSGINVGALSDSFNCLGGAVTDTSNGDLPLVMVIQEISICTGATDEGRAILQIVHDVAPGASLSFASAFNGQAAFASNILALAAAGARVIVDDVLYFAEPMFQDGIIAQAVDSVVAGGVAYFSSAGNQARQSYQSAFRAGDFFADSAFPSVFGAPSFLGGIAHNFNSSGGKNHFQSITIPGLTTVRFSLQWDSPFFSVSGSPGTENDLDIYLLDASATQVLAGSALNNVGGDAVEFLGLRNNGAAPVTLNLMIMKHSGADPGLIKYVYFGSAVINEFDTQSSTIFGHANAVGAEAVGAARYSNTPAFSVSPPILESFSSSGGTPILFDLSGNRLATPDPRSQKPEIVAPDGVDTTFFGSDTDGTGFPNFFGTSAAAPHAAGVAALLLQAKPSLTPVEMYQRLENTAIDMGVPGFDNASGFGLIQTEAAVAVLLNNQRITNFGSAGNLTLAGGIETGGLTRGPAFQLFNTSGVLQTTQFALNPDFRSDLTLLLSNFDVDAADEVLVGGRETTGQARGPAYQLFDADGTFKFTRFVLNPDFIDVSFSSLNVGTNGVLVCGWEMSGLSRGPAYQAFDNLGNLVRTQLVLNPDFTADNRCIGTNLDGIAGDEVIVGGREVTGLARGPAFQVFGSDGSFKLTRFVLNPDFSETKFTVMDVGGSKDEVMYGRETSGAGRGPAYQVFDASGNFILTRFVLNPDFSDFQLFGTNITNSIEGEEIVTGGLETGGLARGPAVQVWDKNGNHLFTRFVLNPDFTEVKFTKIDINNDGVEEILVVGRETKGLARGPAFQLFDGSGNLLVTQFVLNSHFTKLKIFVVDQNGDGDKEIGIGGIETKGLLRGPAYQIFESNGTLIQTRFVLNPDF